MKLNTPIFMLICMLAFNIINAQNVTVRLQGVDGITKIPGDVDHKQPLNLTIDVNIKTHNNLLNRYDANPVFSPALQPSIDVTRFIKYQLNSFFANNNILITTQSPYALNILIDQFEVNYLSGSGWTGSVKVDVALKNQNRLLYEQSTMGFKKVKDSPENYQQGANAVVKAFHQAVNDVNWKDLMSKLEPVEFKDTIHSDPEPYDASARKQTKNQAVVTSDIDTQIPKAQQTRKHTFAVIIGNEKYDNEIPVKYAENDARVFHQYVTQTLGVPEKQAHLVLNATYGKILGELDWLASVTKVFGDKAKIIFYYAGHGMPEESTKKTFLLPIDGNASQVRTAISTREIYKTLSQYAAMRVLVFFDACFSGAARDGMLASGRGVRIKPKEEHIEGNLIVFSAVSGEETAHPFDEQYHGLFSYFLMKKLQQTQGMVTLGDLYDYVRQNVMQKSVINRKEQNPKVNVSPGLFQTWKQINL